MSKLTTSQSKTLKLTNVLKQTYSIQDKDFNGNVAVEQMKSYIRTKGFMQIGPLIQHLRTRLTENNELKFECSLMLQSSQFIEQVDSAYEMEAVVRVPNCMYCRYMGPQEKMKFAYDKIALEAFENDILLQGDSYTVYVDSDEEGNITADVFMPRVEG